MTCDIFCCTLRARLPLAALYASICAKHARGFRQVIVLYPDRDVGALAPVCEQFAFVKQMTFVEASDGHLHMNEMKTSCDLFSDADYFLLMDADCVFFETVTPDYFLTNGLFDLTYVHYDDPRAQWEGGRLPWKEITDAALGRECMYETMQQFPFMYPRWLFSGLREHIERLHGKSFHEYVHTAPNLGRAWHGYSEFCTLGGYAIYFHRDKMQGYNTADPGHKPKVALQNWSHSGLTDDERHALERLTYGWENGRWGKD